MNQIISDTSGLYALADSADVNHARAASFLRTMPKTTRLLISNHIFDETMTLAKARLGMHVAFQLGLRLRNSSYVEMVTFSNAEEMATWHIFTKYRDKAWSYTDCACLALAQSRDVYEAFTFDHHFAQMGLQMRPMSTLPK